MGIIRGRIHMRKEIRIRWWKRKYQEDEKEGRKEKKIFKYSKDNVVFFGPNSAQNMMHAG